MITPSHREPSPVANMRITLWGVQGSTPIFPTPDGLQEYARRIAGHVIKQTLSELQLRVQDGLLRAGDIPNPLDPSAMEDLKRRIGLPSLPFYGGETTCIEVETAEGNILLFDAGTGIRRCSLSIMRRWKDRPDRTLHLFASHEHLDHRAGLTFSTFCYARPSFTVHVYGSYYYLHALDLHYGLFSRAVSESTYVDDPVDFTMMSADFRGMELSANPERIRPARHWPVRDLSPIRIGQTTITPFEVYHGIAGCLGYKVEHGGRSFVFCTDHEYRHGDDPGDPRQARSRVAEERLRAICRGADLAYMDGQYFLDEYLGRRGVSSSPAVSRVDWGHSCIEDVIERAEECDIRHTLVGHHDPDRAWLERMHLDQHLAQLSREKGRLLELADSDRVIDL